MRKIAFFVEGFTEMLFVGRLITEIAGAHNIVVEQKQIRGGSRIPRSITTVTASTASGSENFYVLIYDCGGDHLVKTRILEEHNNLTASGYHRIIGVRDIRPEFSRSEIAKLVVGLKTYIKTSLTPVSFILPVVELEAWFLAEFNHYPKIDERLTSDFIYNSLGFHPENEDMSLRDAPAEDLRNIYQLVQKAYLKGDDATVELMDYGYIYETLGGKTPELKQLIEHIDSFLTYDVNPVPALAL